jgi:spermidine synthase
MIKFQNRLFLSIALISASVITFQVILMQILSFVQWHDFAYMIISVALLGFGAAGTFLSVFREKILRNGNVLMPVCMLLCGISMALVIDLIQLPEIRFDSYLLFTEKSQGAKLAGTYLLLFVPFFLGALPIGIVFSNKVSEIGNFYFFNLVGSGLGGIIALLLIRFFLPASLPSLTAMLPLVAGALILPKKKRIIPGTLFMLAILVISWKIAKPPILKPSQFKDVSKTLLLPEAQINIERNSLFGLIQVIHSPSIRFAPGLSLTAQSTSNTERVVFLNGNWSGVITHLPSKNEPSVLDQTSFALPYRMSDKKKILILRSGTGIHIQQALSHRVVKIVAVESNTTLVSMMKRELANISDSLFYHSDLVVVTKDPRSFLTGDKELYDLVVLPAIGVFGGSAGLFALQEETLLTREAIKEIWNRLSPAGSVTITSWLDYPPRNPLKILGTMMDVLEELKIDSPTYHIVAIKSWATISFALNKSPLTVSEISNTRKFCDQMQFDPIILPGLNKSERNTYNQLQDEGFFRNIDLLLSANRKEFYDRYDFNIKPATDNKPYFNQFIRLKKIGTLSEKFGYATIPFFEIGYVILLFTLVQVTIISFVLILLPLFKSGWKSGNKWSVFLYFGSIAIGYMFVEMAFINRFISFLGNQVYSTSGIICSLLIFSGAGSYMSEKITRGTNKLSRIILVIVLILLLYSFVLGLILQDTIQLSEGLKLIVLILLVGCPAFFMGIPFPAGLSAISKTNEARIPWAWGINGCMSVISTALSTIVAVELGFSFVLLVAAMAYCFALLPLNKLGNFH